MKKKKWIESVSPSGVSDSVIHGLEPTRLLSVHEIFQARILEWVVIPFSRKSSWPRDWTQVSCIAGRLFIILATISILIQIFFSHLGCYRILSSLCYTVCPCLLSILYIAMYIYLPQTLNLSSISTPSFLNWEKVFPLQIKAIWSRGKKFCCFCFITFQNTQYLFILKNLCITCWIFCEIYLLGTNWSTDLILRFKRWGLQWGSEEVEVERPMRVPS